MAFPLETIDAQEISGLVNYFVADLEPREFPGPTDSFNMSIKGFTADVEPLGLMIRMMRTDWIPIGRFRSSWLGKATIGKAYPDIYLAIQNKLDPLESRVIRTRDAKSNYLPVFVQQGEPVPSQSRRPTQDDLEMLNLTLRWISRLPDSDA